MTATLVAKNVAGGFAHRTLFEGLDLTVAPGDVVGVVGRQRRRQEHAAADPGRGPRAARRHGQPRAGRRVRRLAAAGARTGARARPSPATSRAARVRRGDAGHGCGGRGPGRPGVGSADVDPADAYSAALDHWLASGAADLDERLPAVLADLGLDSGALRPDRRR